MALPSIDRLLDLPYQELPAGDGVTLGTHLVTMFPDGGCIDLVRLHRSTFYPLHIHDGVDATISMLLGSGAIMIGDQTQEYKPGMRFSVPRGTPHGFATRATPTVFFSFQSKAIYDPSTGLTDVRYVR